MRCDEVKNLLSNYIENDIEEKIKKSMDEHLAICANCAKELRSLKGMISELKSVPEVEPPPYFLEGVRARLEEPSALTKLLRRLFVAVNIKAHLQAITATATVIIIFFLIQKSQIGKLDQPEISLSSQRATHEVYSSSRVRYAESREEAKTDQLEPAKIPASDISLQGAETSLQNMPQEKYRAAQGEKELEQPAVSESSKREFAKIHAQDFASQAASADLQQMSKQQSSAPYLQAKAATLKSEFTLDENSKAMAKSKQAEPLMEDKKDDLMAQDSAKLKLKEKGYIAAEREITVKTKDLERDIPELNKILFDLGITDIQTNNYADKVLFNFQIPYDKLKLLLSKLKAWQVSISPPLEGTPETKTEGVFFSISLTLTSQETL